MALRRAWLLLVAACAAPPLEAKPGMPLREEPPPAAEAPAPETPDDDAPPAECGRATWAQCLDLAASLEENADPRYHPDAIRLYRLLCNTGDDRRCFEPDTDDALRADCRRKGFAAACHRLGELHAEGAVTCPVDDACAAALFEMACAAGEGRACAQLPRAAPRVD